MSTPAFRRGVVAVVTCSLLSAIVVLNAKPRIIKLGGDGALTETTCASIRKTATSTSDYQSTLVNGYTPSSLKWAGRRWRVNAGSTWTVNVDRSVQLSSSGRKVRFEIRDTTKDRSPGDSSTKRRSELSGSLYGASTRLPNRVPLWGAFSFNHHSWADPDGMKNSWGGVYGQIHMGSTFGGSPAVAFRRTVDGRFRITTRGEYDTAGTIRYQGLLSFDSVHDMVYEVVLDPRMGSLKVWLDGVNVVNVSNVSIGSHYAQSYFNIGLYFSGGITCPVVAENANGAYPATVSLAGRISSPPVWPTS